MHDIFISYSSQNQEQATQLCDMLTKNGFDCWIDRNGIRGGRDYAEVIPKAIKNSRCFLLLLTKAAQESDWVRRELDQAIDIKLPVYPFVLEKVKLDDKWGFLLSHCQRYEAYQNIPRAQTALIQDLAKDLKRGVVVPILGELRLPKHRGRLVPVLAVAAALAVGLWLWPEPTADGPDTGRSRPVLSDGYIRRVADFSAAQAGTGVDRLAILADAADEADPVDAATVLERELARLPDDPVLTAARSHFVGQYAQGVCGTARAQWDGGDILTALATVRQALAQFPDSPELNGLLREICAENPIPIRHTNAISSQLSPDDGLNVGVNNRWDPETDLDINMDRWSGGLEVRMNRLFGGMLFVDGRVTYRISFAFDPIDHTETDFSGYIVLHEDMYNTRTKGTIRILVDGKEVFTTGEVDGSCRESFPFSIDITGAEGFVLEAQAEIHDQEIFAFGLVS